MVDDKRIKEGIIPKYGASIKKKKNVVGWSQKFQPKLREGQPPGEPSFRIYVTKKEDVTALAANDLVPKELDGIKTDIVVVGEVKAVLTDRQSAVRPVPLGVGVGHWDISQGSLGMLYTPTGSTKVVAGSNAHVLTPNPFLSPSEILEKRILQPGAYAQGKKPENVVGNYVWHKQLNILGSEGWGPTNWFGILIWRIIEFLKQLFGVRSQATATSNKIDFAIYEPTVEHLLATVDGALGSEPFIGHLFAASQYFGMICKVEHIINEGYTPLLGWTKVKEGDTVKGSSFWGDYTTTVFDSDASVLVSYGDWHAPFVDTIFVVNDGTIKGGWSGSGFRKV